MDSFYVVFAWAFVSIYALFMLGVAPAFGRQIYPQFDSLSLTTRVLAPLPFALIAAGCFAGFGQPTLIATIIVGVVLIALHQAHKAKPI